ncbi:MAG: 30S ribosomal protein S8 [Limisphaerales bacterium]|jgi:small subunit ribosomal protein S8
MNADPVSDLLTRIRNAGMALHPSITLPHSQYKQSIAEVLREEGYIASVSTDGEKLKTLKLTLKYQGRKPVIVGLKQVSTPGLRRYVASTDIPRVLGGLGVAIVSTPKGVMSGNQARKQNLGGELVCYVW